MISIRTLDFSVVSQLGLRARRCVYWQTEGQNGQPTSGDPAVEKEAWINRVTLEWGACGQLATHGERAAGAVFYAPPGMVPRARCFPTGPVGADAILLAGMSVEADSPTGVLTALLDSVVVDLRSRGIKAIEAFGVTPSTRILKRHVTAVVRTRAFRMRTSCWSTGSRWLPSTRRTRASGWTSTANTSGRPTSRRPSINSSPRGAS